MAVAALVAVAGTASMASAKPAKPAGVTRVTLPLVDSSRPTAANGTYPGAPSRSLPTVVSFPTKHKGRLPLIVFATGIGGTATNYAPLYDHWVRAGYVVAAPHFPLTSGDAPGGTTAADLNNQPGDLSFVLTSVLDASNKKGSKIHGLVDPVKVALVGKSLGAITAFEDGWSPAHRDERFTAIVALTGATQDDVDFSIAATPLLLEHGDADTTAPYSGSQQAFDRAQAPKWFVTLKGATHGSAFGGGKTPAEVVVEKTV